MRFFTKNIALCAVLSGVILFFVLSYTIKTAHGVGTAIYFYGFENNCESSTAFTPEFNVCQSSPPFTTDEAFEGSFSLYWDNTGADSFAFGNFNFDYPAATFVNYAVAYKLFLTDTLPTNAFTATLNDDIGIIQQFIASGSTIVQSKLKMRKSGSNGSLRFDLIDSEPLVNRFGTEFDVPLNQWIDIEIRNFIDDERIEIYVDGELKETHIANLTHSTAGGAKRGQVKTQRRSGSVHLIYLDNYQWAEIVLPPADTIEIISPTSTPAYDFSNWQLEFETATSTTATSTDFYLKRIFVGLSSNTIETLAGSVLGFDSPVSVPNVGTLSPNTLYFSQAELSYFKNFQADRIVVATSSIVSFTTSNLSENDLSYFDTPISTSTTAEWSFTCDPTSGFFTNSFCNLARFLFVPTPASIENFSVLKSQIETKPPMGYFTLIGESLGNINASGTPAFALVGVQALEENFLSPFRAILTIVFYLLFAFWLLHRLRNFDFHL